MSEGSQVAEKSEQPVVLTNGNKSNGNGCNGHSSAVIDAEKFKAYVDSLIKDVPKAKRRAAIFTHATPDPDAIGSQVAMRFLLAQHYDIDADCFVDGDISHPQNKIAVQLLDPHLIPVSKYRKEDYSLRILVDTIPDHAGVGNNMVSFDVVVDHHKALPDDFLGLLIHHHAGSCGALMYSLLLGHHTEFDDENEEHIKVASGIWSAVITDTDFCTKVDTTTRDFEAMQTMFKFADPLAVRKIVRYNWPMKWVNLLGVAINDHVIEGSIAVAGLGMLTKDHHDAVAAVADNMLSWGTVQTAVAFAFFDGRYISGCLRTIDDTIEVHALCKSLGGEHGAGGGKSCQGRYMKPLGAFSFELDEPDETIHQWWELQKQREIAKILKVLSK